MKFPKKLIIWSLIALLIRLILMPITFHPDLWAISFAQYFFSFKGIINIYDYLANLPVTSTLVQNYGQNFFTYPPLSYFTLGIFSFLLKPFFNSSFYNHLAESLPVILGQKELYWHLFLTKFPYLFFDFGVLVLLINLFEDTKKKFLVGILWLFNPLSFYTSYMIGQFDIIPVFFTVLSLYLVKKGKLNWAAFSLGIGGAYKMFPLFFVPFLAFSYGNNIKDKIKLFAIGLFPYVISILPFLGSVAFRQNVLFSNQTQKMLFAKISVSGAEYLSIFVVLYISLFCFLFIKKIDLWKCFLLIMILFFSITHFHPQWFLWIMPFLFIFWVEYPKFKIFPILLFVCWFIIMIFFEPSLSISLFAPINPALREVTPFSVYFSRFYDADQFKSIVRSLFAGASIAFSSLLFKRDENF